MAEELKAGDDCKLVDGTDGYLAEREGGLVCVPKEVEKAVATEESEKTEAAPATPEDAGLAPVEASSDEAAPKADKSEGVKEDAPEEQAAA